MEEKVWQYIAEHALLKEGWRVGAAVSGGSDSMALLVCFYALSRLHGFELCCIHFEHGIRGDNSLRDASFVRDYCAAHDIAFFMGSADVPALAKKWRCSLETAAKHAREEYMDSLVLAGEVDIVATAHHQSDNAESVLMHVLRGSGLSGLRGVRKRYGNYIRPFLCLAKEEILSYNEENAIPFVTDETNADNSYTRNYLRNVLLPSVKENINAHPEGALGRLSVIAEQDDDCLCKLAAGFFDSNAVKTGDSVGMSAESLTGVHPAVAARAIKLACAGLGVTEDVEYVHIESVLDLAAKNRTGSKASLSRNLYARIEYGTLIVGFKGREVNYSFERNFDIEDKNVLPGGDYIECVELACYDAFNGNAYSECFDFDKLPKSIKLRTRQSGDVIRPLGSGKKKLKDYYIDKKLPREERDRTPLLADGANIIWVIGHVISNDYRVDEHTKRIVNMRYYKKGEGGSGTDEHE